MPDETQFTSFVHFFNDNDIFQSKKEFIPFEEKKKATYTGIRSTNSSCQI